MADDANPKLNPSGGGLPARPAFDPYHHWLGIPPDEQPADHYQLLGLRQFEMDPRVIESAADRQMNHVRTFQLSEHKEASQRILNELSAARLCLLNPQKRRAYDSSLRVKLEAEAAEKAAGGPAPLADSLHRIEPQMTFDTPGAQSSALDAFGLADWQPPNYVAGMSYAEPAPTQPPGPFWKQPHWMAAIACGAVAIFALAFLISSQIFSRPTRSASTDTNSAPSPASALVEPASNKTPPAANGSGNRSATRPPSANRFNNRVNNSGTTSSPERGTTITASGSEAAPPPEVTEDEILGILSNAIAAYNFEPWTRAPASEGNAIVVQDIGPNDFWATWRGKALQTEPGIAGEALSFNGVDDWLQFSTIRESFVDNRTTLTISMWTQTRRNKLHYLFDCGVYSTGITLRIQEDETYQFCCGFGNVLDTHRPGFSTQWRHVVAVFDYSVMKMYVDGELVELVEISPTVLDNVRIPYTDASIGSQIKSYNRENCFFDGLADEVVFLPYAATAEQVQSLYHWTKAGNTLPTIPDAAYAAYGVPGSATTAPADSPILIAPIGDDDAGAAAPLDPNSPEAKVRELLSTATLVYNFEEGTYAPDPQETASTLLQDLGPGDMWGKFEGSLKFDKSIAGQAYVFDGKAQAVMIPEFKPPLTAGKESYTVSLWHKTLTDKHGILFDCGVHTLGGFNIVNEPGQKYAVNYVGNYMPTSLSYKGSQWRHLVVVFNYPSTQYYVDGKLVFRAEINPPENNNVSNSWGRIGGQVKSARQAERYFDGLIDEVVILPRAISQSEVTLLHEWTRSGNVLPTIADDPALVKGNPHGVPLGVGGQDSP